MSDDVAYTLTKAYWESKKSLGSAAKWWNGVDLDMLANVLTEIHPGAEALLSGGWGDSRWSSLNRVESAQRAERDDPSWGSQHQFWIVVGLLSVIFHVYLIFSGLTRV